MAREYDGEALAHCRQRAVPLLRRLVRLACLADLVDGRRQMKAWHLFGVSGARGSSRRR